MLNDLKTMLLSDLSKGYEIDQGEEMIIVKTPLRYDDGDHVVVFITPQQNDVFIIDDNGDAATRLIFEGVDLDSEPIQAWLENTQAIHHIQWDDERDMLWCKAHSQALTERVICLAQISVQMQTLIMTVYNEEEEIAALLFELLFLQYKFLLGT